MNKRIISAVLVIAMLGSIMPAFAFDKPMNIVMTDNIINDETTVNSEDIPVIPYSEANGIPMMENISTYSNIRNTETEETALSDVPKIQWTQEDSIKIPANKTEPDEGGYVSANEIIEEYSHLRQVSSATLNEADFVMPANHTNTATMSARTSSQTALDSAHRISNINSKDALALQNQTGRTNFIGDNIGEEYVDPMTGNLVVTETDLVLPGRDGFDLELSRYYSLAQAEVYSKTADISLTPRQLTLEEGMYVVCEEVTNTETGQTSTYYYPYSDWEQASRRIEEIESRDTCYGLYSYDASWYRSSEGEIITLDYHYTSEINSTSYQQMRNSLGTGWSWSFPSVQVVKDVYTSETMPTAMYYHDGKGNVLEVEYDKWDGYRFKNYVGGDITFEIGYYYNTDICSTSRIDYIVEDSDGTEYYFGMFGELRTMIDIYGNKIQFQYGSAEFYGMEEMPRLTQIIDSVGRIVEFDYVVQGDYEVINVTVETALESEKSLNLSYKKKRIGITREIKDSNGNITEEYVSTEQFLESFTNAIGEVTSYYPADYNGERKYTQPLWFTFGDKNLDSYYVYKTSGYTNNIIYLLGNIVRPNSHTYYKYDLCERNLGHSGVSQAYRVSERGDYLFVVTPSEEPGKFDLVEGYNRNIVWYTYSDDYTGYPYRSSIENIPDTYYVAVTCETHENYEIVRRFHKEDEAVLEFTKEETYYNPVGHNLYIKSEIEEYAYKQPVSTKITYSNNQDYEEYTYDSYVYRQINGTKGKAFGKPLTVTEELDYNTSMSTNRKKHAMLYTYDEDTGFMLTKAWYKSNSEKCTETYTYDSNQRISEIELADGSTTTYSYTYTNGHVSKITETTENDTGTTVIEKIYTAATNFSLPTTVKKTVTENGSSSVDTTTYTYDMLLGVVKTATDDNGNVTYYEYDNLGRPTRIVYPKYMTCSSYDTKDIEILPVENISYVNVARDYYNISGSNKLKAQQITTALYYVVTDSISEYSENIDSRNIEVTYYGEQTNYYLGTGEIIESNILDKLTSGENVPDSILTTSYYYDTGFNTITVVNPKGDRTITQYDGLGREVKITDSFDNQHIIEYNISSDEAGFKAKKYFVPSTDIAKKENIVEYKYDRLQRLVSEKGYSSYPDVYSEVRYAYDYVGNLIGVKDANGNLNSDGYTKSNTYDKLNRLTSSKNACNEILSNTYDNAGNIKKQMITDSSGTESVLYQRSYDGEGKLISDTDNAGNSNIYQYNDLGQLVQSIDKDDKYFIASYNELGVQDTTSKVKEYDSIVLRQYSIQNPYGASTVYDVGGTYDAEYDRYAAQIKEITNYNYSPAGNLLEQYSSYSQYTWVDGVYFEPYINYSYDLNGNVSSVVTGTYDDVNETVWGYTTHYEYNKNRLTKVQIDGESERNTADSSNVQYEYYADGKLKSVIYPALTDGSTLKSEYVYDGLSRLTSLTNYKGTEISSGYAYTYDSNGNILTVNETVGTTQNNTTYTYDKLNRIAAVSGSKGADSYYEYDARGNRKVNFEQMDFLTEEEAEFIYNAEDKLYYSEVGSDDALYKYSANGYRYYKWENSDYPEFYIYSADGRLQALAKPLVIELTDGSDLVVMYPTTQYIWGADRVLAKLEVTTGKSYYYLYNGHGDVVQIVDTSGNIVNSYDYDVWGNFITKEETITNHFTYFGQTFDETTGLYYLRARYYDPTTGRFTQQDPAEDGYNWYIYGNQNPVMFVDYTGKSVLAVSAAIVGPGVVDGLATGVIYKFSGKRFGAGFVNGFAEGLTTGLGTYVGGISGAVIGNTLGSALGSMTEDLIYNKDKSVEEIAKSAAESAAWGLISGLSSAYLNKAIDIANEAGSAAQTLMKYDEKFGNAFKIFFEQLVNILGSQ